MSKVIDLQKYRDKLASSPNDNEILEEVVHDASKEMLVNAIWIAKDLDIDIEDMDFVQNMSASFHHYCEALRMGFDIKDKTDGPFVLSEDVMAWIKDVNTEKTEEPDE